MAEHDDGRGVDGVLLEEVGAKLFVTERTAKYDMGEIVGVLHRRNRAEVIEYARLSGLID